MVNRSMTMMAIVVGAALLGGIPSVADARTHGITLAVKTTFHDDPGGPDTNPIGCSSLPTDPCVAGVINSHFRGSWVSDDAPAHVQVRAGSEPGIVDISGTQILRGAVLGCGSGSFEMSFRGTDDFTNPAIGPGGPGATERYTWNVVPGTGTGGLAGLQSGSGMASAVRYLVPPTSADGTYNGSIQCRPVTSGLSGSGRR